MMNVDKIPGQNLSELLLKDPEIVNLKARYKKLTGKHLPGWNWEEYRDLDDYISTLRQMTKEAEQSANKV